MLSVEYIKVPNNSVMSLKFASVANQHVISVDQLGSNIRLGTNRAIKNVIGGGLINQAAIRSTMQSGQEATIANSLQPYPSISSQQKQYIKGKAVTKAVPVLALKESEKIEHRPFPYASGLLFGLLCSYLLYRIIKSFSTTSNKRPGAK